MTSSTVLDDQEDRNVGMGQIVVARGHLRLRAVLGSCVAVVLHSDQHQAGVLGHVVLPESNGRATTAGKFADTAVPAMITALTETGVPPSDIVAKIAGGANMLGSAGPLQIGDANIEAVIAALRAAQIEIVGKDVGGNKGRRISLNPVTGEVTIEMVGTPAITL